jgi:hypothetical protein
LKTKTGSTSIYTCLLLVFFDVKNSLASTSPLYSFGFLWGEGWGEEVNPVLSLIFNVLVFNTLTFFTNFYGGKPYNLFF